MGSQVVMPQLGESVMEGQIVEWFVQPGDKVEQGTPLLEVETDKANTDVPSTTPGYVARILVAAGETVDVGTPLLELSDTPTNAVSSPAAFPESVSAALPPGLVSSPDSALAPALVAAVPQASAPPASLPMNAPRAAKAPEGDRPWNANNIVAAPTAAPAALPMAQVAPPAQSAAGAAALAALAPTRAPTRAPAAKIHAPGQGSPQPAGPYGAPPGARYFRPPVVKAGDGDKVIPFSKRRGIIAEHMVYSKQVSPHVPCFAEIDVTAAMDQRKAHKGRLAEQGVSLSLLAFVLKATCEALADFPNVNSVVGADEIIQRARIHLGIAVETPGGLLVPVIRHADTLSVSGLARAIGELADKARNKKITIDDLSGGTFTVTNPGRKGNLFGAAIINQPQVGILRMGEIRRLPVVRKIDGEEVICIRSMMFLGLSYDHRIIDGVAGNGFLYRVRELIEAANFDI